MMDIIVCVKIAARIVVGEARVAIINAQNVKKILMKMKSVQAVIGVIIVMSIVDILHVRTAVNAVVAANVDNNILIIK